MNARGVRTVITGTLLVLVAWVPSAQAAFPGQNGKIAFTSRSGSSPPVIKTMNPDGTGQVTLRPGSTPDWSPDGTRIAYIRVSESAGSAYQTPADGSTETLIVRGNDGLGLHPESYNAVAWSPDATKVAATRVECPEDRCFDTIEVGPASGFMGGHQRIGGRDATWKPYGAEFAYERTLPSSVPQGLWSSGNRPIWVVESNTDGDEFWPASYPDYSPEAGRILFSSNYPDGADYEIYVVSAAGGTPTRLTNNTYSDTYPAWSPDGTKIAFDSNRDGNREIYTMNADGSNQTRITNDPDSQGQPSWQPLPYPGYARPLSANSLQVPLVPASLRCTAPNREHGPPLTSGSCNPPATVSQAVIVGTSMTGSVRYRTLVGDIRLRLQITDVRDRGTLDDYTGGVEAQATAQLTDRSGGVPATASDVRIAMPAQCAATAATDVGSTCTLKTTLDTLIPGAFAEGQGAVVQLSQVEVIDGGPDGDTTTGGNSVFLRQGVFVP